MPKPAVQTQAGDIATVTAVTNPVGIKDTGGVAITPAKETSVQTGQGGTSVDFAAPGTTPAVALADHAGRLVILQADPANTGNIFWGFSASTAIFILEPGSYVIVPIKNSNLIFVKGAGAGDKVGYGVIT